MAHRKKTLFIAGTDTDIGKTYITKCLAASLSANNINLVTQKWCHSGPKPTDLEQHSVHALTNHKKERLPYCFNLAASPHLAAKHENTSIDINYISQCLKTLEDHYDCVLIEGSGGLMVPLTEELLFIDVIKSLNIQVLLVAPERIGSINQTLVHLKLLQSYKVPIFGVILNDSSDAKLDNEIKNDHKKQIEHFSNVPVLAHINYLANNKAFNDIAIKLKNRLGVSACHTQNS